MESNAPKAPKLLTLTKMQSMIDRPEVDDLDLIPFPMMKKKTYSYKDSYDEESEKLRLIFKEAYLA